MREPDDPIEVALALSKMNRLDELKVHVESMTTQQLLHLAILLELRHAFTR